MHFKSPPIDKDISVMGIKLSQDYEKIRYRKAIKM